MTSETSELSMPVTNLSPGTWYSVDVVAQLKNLQPTFTTTTTTTQPSNMLSLDRDMGKLNIHSKEKHTVVVFFLISAQPLMIQSLPTTKKIFTAPMPPNVTHNDEQVIVNNTSYLLYLTLLI